MPPCLNTISRARVTDSDELGAETMAVPPAAADLVSTDRQARQ
jgi:hypothetical protein